jgi:aryl-alcohol dehydrogenase-like predicted oxidoreductase
MTSPRDAFPRRTFLKGVAAGAAGLSLGAALGREAFADEGAPATPQGVKQRVLGRTGRSVSVVAYGGGGLRPESKNLLDAAWRNGINFIDVAWGYGGGQAELGVGAFLQGFDQREAIFLNTKASGFRPPRGTAAEVHAALKEQLQASLARMQTSYVDCLMWPHGATSPQDVQNPAMQEALRKLKAEGLVRHFGVSSHSNYAETLQAAAEGGFYDVVLCVINICTQNPDEAGSSAGGGRRGRSVEDTRALLKAAKAKDVGVMVMKAANGGFLAPATDALLQSRCAGLPAGWSRHQKLYAYALGQEGVSTVVVGIQSVNHLKEAVDIGKA